MQNEIGLLEEAEAVIEFPQELEEDEEDEFPVMPYLGRGWWVGFAC